MKQLALLFSFVFLISCGACQKAVSQNQEADKPVDNEQQEQQDKEEGFKAQNWNGYFVEAMAGAYQYFLENDKMPASINVEGLDYGRGKMMAASCQILKKIIAEPETWQNEEVVYPDKVSCPDNEQNNTLDIDVMTMEQFLVVVDKIYEYAQTNNRFPNYCTVNANHKDPDGSVYPTKMIINAVSVCFARIFDHFVTNNALPESFSVWHSDFLRSVPNAPKDDPLVVSTMQEVIKGKTTDMEKAKALFIYSLDEWEWENYANTKKGAVGTIKAKGGNCCDLSHALVAMSRAAGLKARYRHAQCKYIKSGSIIGHVMAEIYVDGVWYLCDPSSSGTTFGNHEAWSVMETFNGRYNKLPF